MKNERLALRYSRFRRYYLNWQQAVRKPVVQRSLALSLSFLLTAVLVGWAIRPSLTKIVELKKEIREKERVLEKLKQKTAALERAAQLWNKVAVDANRVEMSVPVGPEYRYLIKEWEEVARGAGVRYISGNFDKALVKDGLEKGDKNQEEITAIPLRFSLRWAGDYLSLLRAGQTLSHLDRVVEIENISFSQGEEVVMTMNGRVYYLENKKKLEPILKLKER